MREDCRAQGVGKALYAELFRQLVALGYYHAFAGVALPNAASVALHESSGFRPLGVYRKVGFKFGAWRDVGWWQKELQPPVDNPAVPRRPQGAVADPAFGSSSRPRASNVVPVKPPPRLPRSR